MELWGERPTLRDWFAINASDADVKAYQGQTYSRVGSLQPAKTRAEARYAYADEMLKVRAKHNTR